MNYCTSKLGSLCTCFSSGANITSEKIFEHGVYPVFGANGIRGYTNSCNFQGKCALIGRQRAYCGNVKYFEGEAYISEHAIILEANSSNNTHYLAYYLGTLQLGKLSGQAAQPGLPVQRLKQLSIKIPDLPTQTKIANILSAYDDAIENNNRRIKILEQLAENLYKEWFVRMRFPGHETAEYENGLPKGWEIRTVGDIARIKSGYAFKSEYWQNHGIKVVKIKDISENIVDDTSMDCVDAVNLPKSSNFMLHSGDLVIAMTGATIGKIGIVVSEEPLCTNQRVGKFFLGDTPLNKMPFLFCFFQQQAVKEQIIQMSGASSAQPNISAENLEAIKLLHCEKTINLFNKKMNHVFGEIIKLFQTNKELAKQRDLLLPRLMSGKMEISL